MADPPLDYPESLASAGWRPVTRWLALTALLGNLMLPAVLSIVFGLIEPGRYVPSFGICGGSPDNGPGKAKSGLLVQHCPLCAVPVASLPRPPGSALPGQFVDQSRLRLRTSVVVASIRHGRMQARAPPSVA